MLVSHKDESTEQQRKAGSDMSFGFFDAAALSNERIERLQREAEDHRLVRASREDTDQGSPRRPKR